MINRNDFRASDHAIIMESDSHFTGSHLIIRSDLHTKEWNRFLLLAIESSIVYLVIRLMLQLQLNIRLDGYANISYQLGIFIFCLTWWVCAFLPSYFFAQPGSSIKKILSFYSLWGPVLLHCGITIALSLSVFRVPLGYYPLLIVGYTSFVLLLIPVRLLYQYLYYPGLQHLDGKFMVAGVGPKTQLVAGKLIRKFGQGKFAGIFDEQGNGGESNDYLGDLRQQCQKNNIQSIFVAFPSQYKDQIEAITQFAEHNFIRCFILPDISTTYYEGKNIDFIEGLPVLPVKKEPLQKKVNLLAKRAFDILFSLFVITCVFPWLIPIIALAIKCNSPGPIFFIQRRPGKRNQLFKCFKFRTMRLNNQTELQATKADPRVTQVGSFLRKTNLDELPQFFNVLLGDMSVVGPRPNMVSQLEYYSTLIPEYPLRHAVAPGITGFAQVKGYRGETRQLHLMKKRVELDLAYIENWSLLFDLKIILWTIKNMFIGEKNAY
jgi:putative colanic acid biosynthesis UDP-glucose lipid carrier transferase